ncbi:MAG TPA: EamA family transporter [Candidatus Paceibacterota bacterium]|jgi:drug/metabolite transporter (DMT)-like permease|nr:EamA family transporter [Candidatus Paceibacterota bacterium]
MFWIFPIVLLIAFEFIADIFSKEYSLKGHWYLWAGALLGYVVANIFWLWSIRTGSGLARGAIIFSVGSAVAATALGFYFYGETVSKIQIAGIILGLLSLILIFWE